MYADDTHLTYADNDICSIEASLNQDLSNINRWLIANKLTLNMTKTEFMLIGSRQKLNSLSAFPALEINGTQLNRVNFTKSLGVLIDENLTWSNHINAITKKISSGIGSIKRISHCVPPATLHTIYHGLVQSHFDYCSVVWGNHREHTILLNRERVNKGTERMNSLPLPSLVTDLFYLTRHLLGKLLPTNPA